MSAATYVGRPHHAANLLHGVQVGAQSSMHGEDLLVNDSSDGQTIETIRESLPELDVVSPLALIVETIDAVDRGAFVVAAEDEEIFGVFDLVCEQQADCL